MHNPIHAVCDNGSYCDGAEICTPTGCQAGSPPCAGGCAENPPQCFCTSNAQCGDGLFCNGTETCVPPVPGGACQSAADGCDCQPGTPPCTDSHASTNDGCSELFDLCVHVPNNLICDDGYYCNGAETCHPTLGCQNGASPDCGDSIACTIDACNETTNSCDHVPSNANCDDSVPCTIDLCDTVNGCSNTPDDTQCDDELFCNGPETCDPLLGCESGPAPCPPDPRPCIVNEHCNEAFDLCMFSNTCDDEISCTSNKCTLSGCFFYPIPDFCDDFEFCNGVEFCDPLNGHPITGCSDGTAPDCNDGVTCTIDGCDNGTEVCTHTPDDSACNDGLSCTDDLCDPISGCEHTPVNAICDDGALCNGTETCSPTAGCLPGVPLSCDDGIPCTVDSCHPVFGCLHAQMDGECDDGVFCNGAEMCDLVDGCISGPPPCPADSRLCIVTSCNEIADTCGYTDTCDDERSCTADFCAANGRCRFIPQHAACDDGVFCNGAELCDRVEGEPVTGCTEGIIPPCEDGLSCTTDNCDESSDTCSHIPNNLECDDGIECTQDVCDLTEGCVHTPMNSLCDDGVYCNGAETCDPDLGCVAGSFPCTSDLRPCKDQVCHEESDSCTYPTNCNDDVDCTTDVCMTWGACRFYPNHAYCQDGLFCNGVEVCDLTLDCQPAPVGPDCSDGLNCTNDSCSTQTDACAHANNCDDLIDCTIDTCLPSGECNYAPSDAACDDGFECTLDLCFASEGCENFTDDQWCLNQDNGLFCNGQETCDPTHPQHGADGCVAGTYPCGSLGCQESTDTCSGCLNNSGCSAGQVCCAGICRGCCTDADCAPGMTCCALGKQCKISCLGGGDTED